MGGCLTTRGGGVSECQDIMRLALGQSEILNSSGTKRQFGQTTLAGPPIRSIELDKNSS